MIKIWHVIIAIFVILALLIVWKGCHDVATAEDIQEAVDTDISDMRSRMGRVTHDYYAASDSVMSRYLAERYAFIKDDDDMFNLRFSVSMIGDSVTACLLDTCIKFKKPNRKVQ